MAQGLQRLLDCRAVPDWGRRVAGFHRAVPARPGSGAIGVRALVRDCHERHALFDVADGNRDAARGDEVNPMPILEARLLCKYYCQSTRAEVRAVDGVSLAVPTGSYAAATGPSGSGKSTLLALFGALERPTRGEVLFDGRDLTKLSDAERTRARRRMGFIFQSFALVARLPLWENVTYPLVP